jgi:hypothetical protein
MGRGRRPAGKPNQPPWTGSPYRYRIWADTQTASPRPNARHRVPQWNSAAWRMSAWHNRFRCKADQHNATPRHRPVRGFGRQQDNRPPPTPCQRHRVVRSLPQADLPHPGQGCQTQPSDDWTALLSKSPGPHFSPQVLGSGATPISSPRASNESGTPPGCRSYPAPWPGGRRPKKPSATSGYRLANPSG